MILLRIRACACAAACAAAALTVSAPAQAEPPQCDSGPIVVADCPAGGLCTAVIDNQCVGVQAPMLPPPPDVRVGIRGDIGVGI
ncbi:MAG TPA: hypothetical protein VMS92_18570 [Mycobacterium sp.]|nr:hypothetical protein [Mycobacterium sp.]